MRSAGRGDTLKNGLRALVGACAVLLVPVGLSAAQQPALPAVGVAVPTETQLGACDGSALAECLPGPPDAAVAPTGREQTPAADGDAAPARPQSAGRDGPATTEPRARPAAAGSVTIKDFSFQPPTITVNVGDSVTWTNEDSAPHSATADDGSFDTGVFGKGQSRSHTFTKAGDFTYFCEPHPHMKGTVRVVASDSGGSDPQREPDTGTGADTGTNADPRGGADSGSSANADGHGATQTRAAAAPATGGGGASLPDTGANTYALLALGVGLMGTGFVVRRLGCKRQGTATVD